jgi:GntR family transcriptional regulator
VAEKTLTTNLDQWHGFTQEMNQKGIVFKTFQVSVDWVKAEPKVSAFFGIGENARLLCLCRLRGDDDGPFVHFESYFHPRIGLTGKEDFSRPLYELLEKDFHVIPSLSKERIKARLASPAIAKRLKIHSGDPVLVRERYVLDPGDRPVEYNIGYYKADKFTYAIDIRR